LFHFYYLKLVWFFCSSSKLTPVVRVVLEVLEVLEFFFYFSIIEWSNSHSIYVWLATKNCLMVFFMSGSSWIAFVNVIDTCMFLFDHHMYQNKMLFQINLVKYCTLNDNKGKKQSHFLLFLLFPHATYNHASYNYMIFHSIVRYS